MIGTIIQWSLRNRLVVVATSLLLLVWGGIETHAHTGRRLSRPHRTDGYRRH
jgi:hypothetical protein